MRSVLNTLISFRVRFQVLVRFRKRLSFTFRSYLDGINAPGDVGAELVRTV